MAPRRTPATTGRPKPPEPARATTPRSPVKSGARQPRQGRGEERICAVLDAAAALLQEVGPASVTVHGIAERAKTSIGSFYHFFPSLDSVYLELVNRYAEGMEAAAQETASRSDAAWRRLSAAEAVEATFAPITRLLARHGYIAALRTMPAVNKVIMQREHESATRGHAITGRLIRARNPRLPPRTLEAATAVFLGTLRGGFAHGRHLPQQAVITEIKRALTAQLEALDRL